MPENQIFPPPAGGWICFHCGQKCRTRGEAELHFGMVHDAKPACRLMGKQFAMLQELRATELQRDEFEVRLNASRFGLDKAGEDEAVERFRADRAIQ